MELFGNVHILIVDDEPHICSVLERVLLQLEVEIETYTDPLAALQSINTKNHDILLVDVQMPGMSGLELMPLFRERNPESKVIIMTGYADKDIAIKALQLGAFDFMEKPIEMEILLHNVKRAIDAWQKELELKQSIEDLKRSQSELLVHKGRLENLNKQLMENNRAMSILAKSFEREREEMEKRIALKLRTLMVPTIERLRHDKGLARWENELNLLLTMVEDLTSGLHTDARVASLLSYTELRIASLIKNGVTTEDIARQLNISPSTVRTHRKNIRKKLKINNGRYNLRNFLSCKSGEALEE